MDAFYELAFTSILTETYRRTGLYATHPSKVKLLPIHNYSRVPHPFYAFSCGSMAYNGLHKYQFHRKKIYLRINEQKQKFLINNGIKVNHVRFFDIVDHDDDLPRKAWESDRAIPLLRSQIQTFTGQDSGSDILNVSPIKLYQIITMSAD